MTISVFDLFSVGIGPSSSHTVGPMRAALAFARSLTVPPARVRVELFGSLGATARGHGTVRAVVAGLAGEVPERIEPGVAERLESSVGEEGRLPLLDCGPIPFSLDRDVVLHRHALPFHSNGMTFTAFDAAGSSTVTGTWYSVGGGFVVQDVPLQQGEVLEDGVAVPYEFTTGAELLAHTDKTGLRISDVMLANELVRRSEAEVRSGLLGIWAVMQECVAAGCAQEGELPGPLKVRRRAAQLHERLVSGATLDGQPAIGSMDWVTVYALAVNEQNASGGRVVTAPTNGAAGIVPAVLHYYARFVPGASDDGIVRFLLVAGAIGVLFKETASISGAEVGCQGEVGSACSMAAGGLAELLGGTPEQVENAAEIGIEHNLGLTCDPVGGLVQIPCIERNAIGAVKAIAAARMALHGDGQHHVSLDAAIRTMRDTGADMMTKYKETSLGGLAVNVVEC